MLVSRRGYLTAAGTAAIGGVGGCLAGASGAVRLLSAGSLARTFEDHVGPAFRDETGVTIRGEYYGSNAVMRMVEDGTGHPDVVASADAALLRAELYDTFTDWDVEFATNSLGLAYEPATQLGRRLEGGDRWCEAVSDAEDGDVAIGDPDLDPLGYRAIQAFELAEREHDLDGFTRAMLDLVYREPEEPQLMAGVETGSRAAAVVYRNMAIDHGVPFVEFPDAYDFSEPGLADHYGTVAYTTENGYTAQGRPILYNATVIDNADNPTEGRQLVRFLVENPDVLREAGLTVGGQLARSHGVAPEVVRA